jgi:hypothetical protein
MKALEIVVDEFKKEGIELLEENAKTITKILFDKVLPRLAVESEESAVKMVAGVAVLAGPAIKESILKLADNINKADNA